ncbi:Reticulon-like protein B23 [Vitis vinifera]|nr:Reticulon-like protein B23 [Vitis vinifera]
MRDVRFVEFKTGKSELQEEERNRRNREMDYRAEIGKPVIVMICGTLIYYHCAYRNSTLLTLVSDVLIVLLCSLAILGAFVIYCGIARCLDAGKMGEKFTQLRQVLGDLLWHWAPFGCCETLEKDVGQKDEALTGLEEGKIGEIYTRVPVDPLEWQISQDTANNIVACMANTIGAAESVLRVAATGHDKRLFVKVVVCLYVLSALGRVVSGVTVAYAGM